MEDRRKPKTWSEAVEMAKEILKPFVPEHPRIRLFIGFYVQPAIEDSECHYFETIEEALEDAKIQDEIGEAFARVLKQWEKEGLIKLVNEEDG